jgi:hypothetical protein
MVGSWRARRMENVSSLLPKLGLRLIRCYSIELGLGWFGNYDAYDLGALSLLSHGPPVGYCSRLEFSANS